MYPKLQSQGLAGGPNTGSCAAYAYYLEHENHWKKKNGHRKDIIPFYDQNGKAVSVGTVINTIDANKQGLHVEDAKFFSLVINPSEKEIAKMGVTREERIKALEQLVDKMMDRYAAGFRKQDITSHNDLLYFYTIHEFREDKKGDLRPGIHVHIIVSRKDINGKYKLSPMTNHRGETAGVIKSGFNRDTFYRDCESIFDTTYGYERRIVETYDYLNTLKHGTTEEKSAMIRAGVQEEGLCSSVTNSLARRAARLAQEAATAEAKRQREAELARLDEDKKKRNEFWNSYQSYYRPTLDKLNDQCKSAFSLYNDLKAERADIHDDISKQYEQLRNTYELMSVHRAEIQKDRDYEDLVKSFAYLLALANPIPILILSLVLLIVLEEKRENEKADIQTLRHQAEQIRANIEHLQSEQEKLKLAQQDTLRQYIQVKDEKTELKNKLNELKSELDKPLETGIDLESLAKELAEQKTAPEESCSFGVILNALGVYGAVMAAETKLELDLELLTDNTVIEPIFHPNGGVADFRITTSGTESLASKDYSDEKLAAMLEKWSILTGQTPAYKMTDKTDTDKSIATKPNIEKPWITKKSSTPSPRYPSSSKLPKPSKGQQRKP